MRSSFIYLFFWLCIRGQHGLVGPRTVADCEVQQQRALDVEGFTTVYPKSLLVSFDCPRL